jgi:hypothetical protein
MYRIQASTLSVTSHYPRGLTTLGVSWLGGQFDAVALHRGEIVGTWHAPESCEDIEKFGELLRQAVDKTGFQGNTVHLVLSHSKLSHQIVDVPDARGPALKALVHRQVDKLKLFDEVAAWTFEKSEPTKNSSSALVHLLPRAILYRLVANADQAGFHLVSVVPPTAVLHAQFARLPLDSKGIGLIAADIDGGTTIVVARREGPLFLARSLDASRARGSSALVVDINRTLLYVSQRFGVDVTGVWLYGSPLTELIEEFRPQLHVPVEASAEPLTGSFWAQESLRIPAEFTPNLVSARQIRAPRHRALLKLTTVLAAAAVVAMLAAAAWFHLKARSERQLVNGLLQQTAQLQAEHQTFQQSYQELSNRERFIQGVLDHRPGPVPIWLAAYLGEITPDELIITNLHIVRQTNTWHVSIGGKLQPAANQSTRNLLRGVEELADKLRNGPFQATVLPNPVEESSPPASTSRSATTAFADWASQLRPAKPKLLAPPTHFVLEALLQ